MDWMRHSVDSMEWMLADVRDEHLQTLVREVFYGLPDEIQNRLLSMPTRMSTSHYSGAFPGGRSARAWTAPYLGNSGGNSITLFLPMLKEQSDDFCRHTIAHEFAHAILGHPKANEGIGHDLIELRRLQQENEANRLAKSWGYPDPELSEDSQTG